MKPESESKIIFKPVEILVPGDTRVRLLGNIRTKHFIFNSYYLGGNIIDYLMVISA